MGRIAEGEAEEKRVHFFSYMDKQGRILVPLRNREEADIVGIWGADVEVDMIVKKVYKKGLARTKTTKMEGSK
jgi:hypothetical protein